MQWQPWNFPCLRLYIPRWRSWCGRLLVTRNECETPIAMGKLLDWRRPPAIRRGVLLEFCSPRHCSFRSVADHSHSGPNRDDRTGVDELHVYASGRRATAMVDVAFNEISCRFTIENSARIAFDGDRAFAKSGHAAAVFSRNAQLAVELDRVGSRCVSEQQRHRGVPGEVIRPASVFDQFVCENALRIPAWPVAWMSHYT